MTIGERIKIRRNELKWSQRELSDKMGYSNHSTITKIEAGKVDIPQSRIVQFAEVLGVNIAYLMGWDKDPEETAEFHARVLSDEQLMKTIEEYCSLDSKSQRIVRNFVHSLTIEE